MAFEVLHFRDSNQIIKSKNMEKDIEVTLQHIDESLTGTLYKRDLFKQALDDMDWIQPNGDMVIIENRRYRWKGYKKGIAMESNLNNYEYILEGCTRLQIGYDTGKIDMGILLLNSKRSDKSPYGDSVSMVKEDIQNLYPTISLPVTICLFDFGEPTLPE